MAGATKNLQDWASYESGLSEILAPIPGLDMQDASSGTLTIGNAFAILRIEPDWIRVRCAAVGPAEPLDALRLAHRASGNVRYARGFGKLSLVADTRLDGMAHLPATLAEIRQGLLQLNTGGLCCISGGEAHSATTGQASRGLGKVVRRLPFGDDALVSRDADETAWEIRPRVSGSPVPVLLDSAPSGGVRLHSALPVSTPCDSSDVVADQALRLNELIRFCRIAFADERWVVETLLYDALVEAGWIAVAAQAVATVSRHVAGTLDALASNSGLAHWYRTLLFRETPGTVPGCRSSFQHEETRDGGSDAQTDPDG